MKPSLHLIYCANHYFASRSDADAFASKHGADVKQTSPAFYDAKTGHSAGLFRVIIAARKPVRSK